MFPNSNADPRKRLSQTDVESPTTAQTERIVGDSFQPRERVKEISKPDEAKESKQQTRVEEDMKSKAVSSSVSSSGAPSHIQAQAGDIISLTPSRPATDLTLTTDSQGHNIVCRGGGVIITILKPDQQSNVDKSSTQIRVLDKSSSNAESPGDIVEKHIPRSRLHTSEHGTQADLDDEDSLSKQQQSNINQFNESKQQQVKEKEKENKNQDTKQDKKKIRKSISSEYRPNKTK